MASISVTYSGLDGIRVKIEALSAALQQRVNDRVQEAGINVQAAAKIACPVGTPESTHKKGYHGGRLRQSIQYVPGWLQCSVGSDVYYAPFVENGHRLRNGKHLGGKFFLTNAFIDERRAFLADLQGMVP